MNKNLLLVILISILLCQIAGAQETIDLLMKSQLRFSSSGGYAQLDADDGFNIPLVGRSENIKYKSKYKAALLSLMLPGAGQYYVENNSKAKIFLGIESAFWLSYYGFRKFGAFKDDAAKGWAVAKAGASPDNTDELYWIKMTYYDNRDRNESQYELGYNQMIGIYEGDNAVFFPETPEYYWNWNNRDDRQKYRNLRNQSKNAYERADVIVGVIIANHVVSAVEALLSTVKYNRRLEFSKAGFKFHYAVKPSLNDPAITVSLIKYFD
ncbi:MAG: hypothetical protein J7K40_12530 [candidate division Zixibacteria bacterium]|nr:hypothetical protein [candidate division Zixibacteria bacterium]